MVIVNADGVASIDGYTVLPDGKIVQQPYEELVRWYEYTESSVHVYMAEEEYDEFLDPRSGALYTRVAFMNRGFAVDRLLEIAQHWARLRPRVYEIEVAAPYAYGSLGLLVSTSDGKHWSGRYIRRSQRAELVEFTAERR